MKRLLFIHLLLPCFSFGQQIVFEKSYNYGFAEAANCVQQTFDGGYIMAGRQGIAMNVMDLMLIKTDSAGNEEWKKFYGTGANDNVAYSIEQTTDSGYIVCGRTTVMGMGSNVYLMKTDANGDTLWTKHYGTTQWDNGWDVQQTYDGGYIIAAQWDTTGCLIKTNATGDTLWKKTTPGGVVFSLNITQDSGYVLCGIAPTGGGDVYVVRTDSLGDTLWTRTIGGPDLDNGQSVRQTSDGGFIVTGYTWSFGAGNYDVYLIRLDANGDTLWTRTYGDVNENVGQSVQQTTDGSYIITGYTDLFGVGGTYDVYLIKVDNNGTEEWAKTYGVGGPTVGDIGEYVIQTNDDGYAICGMSGTTIDAYLIKTDSLGNRWPVSIPPEPPVISFNIYPNPTTGNFTVANATAEIQIFDLFGRLVLRSNETQIDMSSYPSGLYVWQVGTARGKLVIE